MNSTKHSYHIRGIQVGKTMSKVLSSSLNPNPASTPRCLEDPLLVTIDVGLDSLGLLESIGIVCLDSRLIANDTIEASVIARSILTRRQTVPLNKRSRIFLFGRAECLSLGATRDVLHEIFCQVDKSHGNYRNVLLVGHSVNNDIRYLAQALAFDIKSMPSVIAVIDTQQVARCVYATQCKYPSLHSILLATGVDVRQLHNSGNDAVYTLKALLHLFCSYQEATICTKLLWKPTQCAQDDVLLWRERIALLKAIAQHFPCKVSVRQLRQATRQPKPPRQDHPVMMDVERVPGGEAAEENVLGNMFDGTLMKE